MYWRISKIITMSACAGLLSACASTSWVKRSPKEDAQNKYYVGRSYKMPSANQALSAARTDARMRAIESNFPNHMHIEHETYESMDDSQSVSRSKAVSSTVQLIEFEEIDMTQPREVEEDEYSAEVLYRYSKTAIKREKERLKRVSESSEQLTFNLIDPKSSATPNPQNKAIEATFVIGFRTGGQASSIQGADNSSLGSGVQGEYRIKKDLGMTVFFDTGERTTSYTNGTLTVSKTVLGVGIPYYLSRVDRSSWSLFTEPHVQVIQSNFAFSKSVTSPESKASKTLVAGGINLGLQARFIAGESGGFSVRPFMGVARSLDNNGVSGTTFFQGGLVFQWEIFKK